MGSQNCKEWSNTILFPEEDVDEMKEWMEYKSIDWSYAPTCFPGTQLRHVQPVYKTDMKDTQNNSINKRSVLLVNKDYRKNRDLLPRKTQQKFNSAREEIILEENCNNNVIKLKRDDRMEIGKALEDQGMDDDKDKKTGFPTGRVYVAMSHDPITSRLKVAIIKAKNLSCKQSKEKDKCGINCSASFMTVSLVEGDHVIDTFTTAIKTGYSEVLYYENFAFHLNEMNLRGMSVVITAKHSNKPRFIKHSHVIGSVILNGLLVDDDLSMDSHLVEVTTHPGQTLYKWHTLWR